MEILLTGGTGLIGRALCRALQAEGHRLTVLSRQPQTVAEKCGPQVRAMGSLDEWTPERHFDAVINLAGEPIADRAWTAARKQALRDSRVTLTEQLVARIAAAQCKPAALLSGSAVGYYGNGRERMLTEKDSPGEDFAALLCRDWEAAARRVEAYGVRVCLLRTGLVLSREGGLLGKLELPFSLGLGARLGDGRQYMSWIHIRDHVAMTLRLLHDATLAGPFNLAAPQPVTNAEFTRALGQALHRPALFVAPGFLLKLGLGERASLLLEGQRVIPQALQASRASFAFSAVTLALADLFPEK